LALTIHTSVSGEQMADKITVVKQADGAHSTNRLDTGNVRVTSSTNLTADSDTSQPLADSVTRDVETGSAIANTQINSSKVESTAVL